MLCCLRRPYPYRYNDAKMTCVMMHDASSIYIILPIVILI